MYFLTGDDASVADNSTETFMMRTDCFSSCVDSRLAEVGYFLIMLLLIQTFYFNPKLKLRLVAYLVQHIAIGATGLGFDSRAGKIGHSVAIAATFL